MYKWHNHKGIFKAHLVVCDTSSKGTLSLKTASIEANIKGTQHKQIRHTQFTHLRMCVNTTLLFVNKDRIKRGHELQKESVCFC